MIDIKKLDFRPLLGLSSKHLQILMAYFFPMGNEPPTKQRLVDIGNGDRLSCEVSTPLDWNGRTIVLIHGLGGSHLSSYMVRMARKLYQRGNKVVRINLRGCGSGKGLSKLPCGAGNSKDIVKVLQRLKEDDPESEIIVIGYSLGGNTTLKLAGELGEEANKLVKAFIAVCPVLDLEKTVRAIQQRGHWLYHRYYLNNIIEQAHPWINHPVHSIFEYDNTVSGPLWGFNGAQDYYQKCSSKRFLGNIRSECHLIFAEDDPFVSMDTLKEISLPKQVHVWASKYGSHMGFLGPTNQPGEYQWMDQMLLNLLQTK